MTGGSRGGWRRGADTNALLVAASAASNVAARRLFPSVMLTSPKFQSCCVRYQLSLLITTLALFISMSQVLPEACIRPRRLHTNCCKVACLYCECLDKPTRENMQRRTEHGRGRLRCRGESLVTLARPLPEVDLQQIRREVKKSHRRTPTLPRAVTQRVRTAHY